MPQECYGHYADWEVWNCRALTLQEALSSSVLFSLIKQTMKLDWNTMYQTQLSKRKKKNTELDPFNISQMPSIYLTGLKK